MADLARLVVVHGYRHAIDGLHGARLIGQQHVGGIMGCTGFDAGADVRSLGTHQGHGLTLHVGTHQGSVRVVVFKERDERCGHRDDLLRRDVHELDLIARYIGDFSGGTKENVLF